MKANKNVFALLLVLGTLVTFGELSRTSSRTQDSKKGLRKATRRTNRPVNDLPPTSEGFGRDIHGPSAEPSSLGGIVQSSDGASQQQLNKTVAVAAAAPGSRNAGGCSVISLSLCQTSSAAGSPCDFYRATRQAVCDRVADNESLASVANTSFTKVGLDS
jgi:hypothetical protein